MMREEMKERPVVNEAHKLGRTIGRARTLDFMLSKRIEVTPLNEIADRLKCFASVPRTQARFNPSTTGAPFGLSKLRKKGEESRLFK